MKRLLFIVILMPCFAYSQLHLPVRIVQPEAVSINVPTSLTPCIGYYFDPGITIAGGDTSGCTIEWTPVTGVTNPSQAETMIMAGPSPETYTITIVTSDGCTYSESFYVAPISCAGIDDKENMQSFRMYPNPSNDLFYLYAVDNLPIVEFAIFSTEGRIIDNVQITQNTEKIWVIDGSSLPAGFYLVNVKTTESLYTIKMMKQ